MPAKIQQQKKETPKRKRKRKPGPTHSLTPTLPCKNPHHTKAPSPARAPEPMALATTTTTTPLAPLALAPPSSPIFQCSLLLLRPRGPALSLRSSAPPGARLLVAVAAKEPELGGSEGGGGAGGSGGGGDSEKPREGGEEGEGEEGKEEKMGQGLSMSQKLTLAYAALVGAGGAMGYMKSGSQKSLAAGGISALVLYFVHTQLPVRPVFASSVGLGISAALLSVMGSRFKKSGKIFPAGVVSLVSLVMVGGYFHGILRSSHA
ncbi:hypothetical protein E2562_004205 [Oryza meyeriana var. granulata]|uniref:Uncharacterized protein n=1 Tax=Oryza meyeriana var. granulata TaxID=110450 RepID=A0A6G1BS86_9ORYZ|nr:hypothetical protein E2562_004205 [Oryza meyeriana var. granulata]